MDPEKNAPDLDDIDQRFSQQQVMITQLKEMVLAEESARNQKLADTRLKVEKYTSQLAKIRDRTKSSKSKTSSPRPSNEDAKQSVPAENVPTLPAHEDSEVKSPNLGSTSQKPPGVVPSPSSSEPKSSKPKMPSSEVTKMLHQQIKEHKATLAERAKNEKEIEKAIMKIQKQLEESQNVSSEAIQAGQSKLKSNIPPSSDTSESIKVIELKSKIIQLENSILDLQETCKEKDAVIKSKTDAITLMSADLSKKGKDTLDMLDETKEQMQKMQENFASMESDMKSEKNTLFEELEACKNKIAYLEQANSILEGERFKLSIENATLEEKIQSCETIIKNLNSQLDENLIKIDELNKLASLSSRDVGEEPEKGMIEIAEMDALTNKIEELERLNFALAQSNSKLEEELSSLKNTEITTRPSEVSQSSPPGDNMELKNAKDVLNTFNSLIDSLNSQILDIELTLDKKELIRREDSAEVITEKIEGLDDESLLDRVKQLEKIIHTLRTSAIESTYQSLVKPKSQSKSPEKEKPAQSKTQQKSNKPQQKNKKSQKSKAKVEEPKDEELTSDDFLEAVKNQCYTIVTLSKQFQDKYSFLQRKQSEELIQIEKNDKDTSANEAIETEAQAPLNIESEKSLCDVIGQLENDDIKSLKEQLDSALEQIESLSKEISDSNKNMIKLKAFHKTKIKQMQKCIDDYSKVSDSNSEVVRLQGEVNSLTQRIAELEDDKGNLQLHLVDYDSDRVSDSQLHAKFLDLERISEERLKAIADLEKQKFELVQELHFSKQKVSSLEDRVADLTYFENEHVSIEIKCAQLEEQIDSLKNEIKSKAQDINILLSDKSELLSSIEKLNVEKTELNTKLEFYIQENIDLIDRLDKLSAEKVSSAESIEMVEALTTQEKIEIEQFQKDFTDKNTNNKEVKALDDESLAEKSELLKKIELFTIERQEVMEKIENLQIANNALSAKLDDLAIDKQNLEKQLSYIQKEKDNLHQDAKIKEEEISNINNKIENLTSENTQLQNKLSELTKNQTITEVIVSETVEIEDSIEKKFIEPPKEIPQITEVKSTKSSSSESVKSDKKSTKEILRLKNCLKQKESEISSLTSKISELSVVNDENQRLLGEISTISKNLDESISKNETLNEKLQKLQSDSSENSFREEQSKMLQEEIDDYKNQIKELENVIEKQNQYVTCNENVITYLQRNIYLLNVAITENEDEISDLKLDLAQHTSYSDKMNFLSNELQEKIKILCLILTNNKKEIEDLLGQRDLNTKELNNLRIECSDKDKKIDELNKTLDEINSKLSERVEPEVDIISQDVTDSINNMKNEIIVLNEKNIELYNQITGLEQQLQHKCDLYSKVEMELAEAKNKLILFEQHFNEMNYTIQSLQELVASLKSKNELLEENLTSLNFNIHNVQTLNGELEKKLTTLSSEKDNVLLQFNSHKEQYENLVSQNRSLQEKLSDYDDQLKKLSHENMSTLEKLEEKMSECDNIKVGLSKINILEDDLHSKQIEIKTLLEKLEEIQSNFKEAQSAHEAKTQENDAYVENLESEINKLKDRNSRLENKISLMETLEKKAKKLVMKIQEKDAVIAKKVEQENVYQKKIEDILAEKDSYQNHLASLKEENEFLQTTINKYQEEKTNLRSELEREKSDSQILHHNKLQLEQITQEKIALVQKYSDLEQKIQNLTAEYNENIKHHLKEKQDLENLLQSQSENYDAEYENFNVHTKKMQEELLMHSQNIKDMEEKNNNLKIDYENLLTEKHNLEILYYASISKESDDSNIQKPLESLSSILSRKEKELSNYKMIMTGLETFESQGELKGHEKDEVEKLGKHLMFCQSEIQHLFEIHSNLQKVNDSNSKIINEKDNIIKTLESEIQHLKSLQLVENEEIARKSAQHQFACVPGNKDNSSQERPVNFDWLQDQIIPWDAQHQATSASEHKDKPSQERPVNFEWLQDQIITSDDIDKGNMNMVDVPMIRAFQHDPPIPTFNVSANVTSADSIAVEETITPKSTYLCFSNESPENSERASELQNTIDMLKHEKEKLAADLAQSQTKANKALLKLKEFKMKNDALNSELKRLKSNSGFDILDSAIQDELSSQVKALEEKLKELKSVSSNDKAEKENLLKRVDVLTSANERLIAMKEKQDMELDSCLKTKESLMNQLKNVQRNPDTEKSVHSEPTEMTSQMIGKKEDLSKLTEKIENLQTDNDELESLLNQKTKELEKLIVDLKNVTEKEANLQADIETLIKENTELKMSIDGLKSHTPSDQNNELLESIQNLQKQNKDLELLCQEKCQELETQSELIKRLIDEESKKNNALEHIQTENVQLKNLVDESISKISNLEHELYSTGDTISYYEAKLETSKQSTESYKRELETKNAEIDHVKNQLQEISQQFSQLQASFGKLENEKSGIKNEYEQLVASMSNITDEKEKLLKTAESNYNLELSTVLAERDTLNQKLDEVYKILNDITSQKEVLRVEIEEKSLELQRATNDFADAQQEIVKLKNDLLKFEHKIKDNEQKISQLELLNNDIAAKYENEVLKNSSNDNELRIKLEDTESNYLRVVDELKACKQSLDLEQTKSENLSKELEVLTSSLAEKEQKLITTSDLYEKAVNEKSELEELIHIKDSDLQKYYEYEAMCTNKFNEISAIFNAKDAELQERMHEIQTLTETNNSVHIELTNNVRELEALSAKVKDYDALMEQYTEAEFKLKELTARDDNIDDRLNSTFLESTISELNVKLEQFERTLKEKNEECLALRQRLQESQTLADEETDQMKDMRSALESQELEIVTLKENLNAQIVAYEKLSKSHSKHERHVSFSEDTKPGDDTDVGSGATWKESDEDKPSKAGLDLALYMLHQRDVRCEELTVELMQLLEERDTLQLKLSNSIRTIEEMKSKFMSVLQVEEASTDQQSASVSEVRQAPGTSVDPNKVVSDTALENKISELHKVNHLRDVRVKDEREERQKQMELLQRDIQNLPPEAVAQLREASYTLSRDTQSTSTVLFNWLWGKTTPKVVHM